MQRHPHPPGALRPPCAALPPLTHLPRTPNFTCSQRHAADGPALRTLRPTRRRPLRRACEASPRRGPGGQASRAAMCMEWRGVEVMRTGLCRANRCLPATLVTTCPECCLPPGQPALLSPVAATRALLCCRAERSSGSFWSGFVVGGVVCGALGFIFAPQVNRDVQAGPLCAAVLAHGNPAALIWCCCPGTGASCCAHPGAACRLQTGTAALILVVAAARMPVPLAGTLATFSPAVTFTSASMLHFCKYACPNCHLPRGLSTILRSPRRCWARTTD